MGGNLEIINTTREIHDQPLVSIVTPCYNGEKYVHRFLNSFLRQTYTNMELIFVNNGSTDKTEEIVLSFKNKLEDKGIRFIYIYQENKGVSGAINAGWAKINGKYLCWPDSDDYLEETSIEKRARVLEENPEYAVVTSDAYIRHINNLDIPVCLVSGKDPNRFLENQFELMLLDKSIFCSGCHMVRVSKFMETHPGGQIFPCKRGQNWQMLLPLYYKYKRYFLDEPLYNYIRYPQTMSQGDDTQEKKIYRCDEHVEILLNTINTIDMPATDKTRYIDIIKSIYARKKLNIAYKYGDKELLKAQYKFLMKNKRLRLSDLIVYLGSQFRWFDYLIKCICREKELLKKLIEKKGNVENNQ